MRILIVGSNGPRDVEASLPYQEACKTIGAKIASAGAELIIGSGRKSTADRWVLEGFARQPPGDTLRRIRVIRPAPRSDAGPSLHLEDIAKLAKEFGLSVDWRLTKEGWEDRIPQVAEADGVIALGGRRGTRKAMETARDMRRPLLPTPWLGGASADFWFENRKFYEAKLPSPAFTGLENGRDSPQREWAAAARLAVSVLIDMIARGITLPQAGNDDDGGPPPGTRSRGDRGDWMPPLNAPQPVSKKKAFIVHGRDHGARDRLCTILRELSLDPVILDQRPNIGRALIEKFEQESDVDFAFVLLTPDDLGQVHPDLAKNDSERRPEPRARQNVLFEWGYLTSKITRRHVCLVMKGEVRIPADLEGLLWTCFEPIERLKAEIVNNLAALGYKIEASEPDPTAPGAR